MTDPVFFAPSRRFSAAEVAHLTGAELVDPRHADVEIDGIAPAGEGGNTALIYVEGRRNAALAANVRAAAVLCTADIVDKIVSGAAILVTPRPQLAFAQVGRLLFPRAASPGSMTGETGISPAAHIDATAMLEAGVIVEAGAVIGAHASIGSGTIVAPNAVIGQSSQIGRDCYIGPAASIQCALVGDRVIIHGGAMIGQDGFGFVFGSRGPERIPQIGRVIIQDDVEIGASTTVDRGAMADTVIGLGTKIDNLVQIAHNVRIGRGCIVAGQCGLSGSVTLGDHVLLGGGAGVTDHISIGSRAQIGAGSGVMSDVPEGQRWAGAPAVPIRDFFRQVLARQALAKAKKGDDNG